MPKDDKTAAGVVQPVESEENQLFRDLATMHLRMQQLWRKFVALEEQVAAFWRAPLTLISLVIEKRLKATHDLVAAWEKEMGKTHKLPSLENHLTKLQESKNKLAAYQARLVEVSKLDWVAYTSETRALLPRLNPLIKRYY